MLQHSTAKAPGDRGCAGKSRCAQGGRAAHTHWEPWAGSHCKCTAAAAEQAALLGGPGQAHQEVLGVQGALQVLQACHAQLVHGGAAPLVRLKHNQQPEGTVKGGQAKLQGRSWCRAAQRPLSGSQATTSSCGTRACRQCSTAWRELDPEACPHMHTPTCTPTCTGCSLQAAL